MVRFHPGPLTTPMSREEHPSFRPSYVDRALVAFKEPLSPYKDGYDFAAYPSRSVDFLDPAIRTTFAVGLDHFEYDNPNPFIRRMAAEAKTAIRNTPIPIGVGEHVAEAAARAGVPLILEHCEVTYEPTVISWRPLGEQIKFRSAVALTPQYLLVAAHDPKHALTSTARMMSRIRDTTLSQSTMGQDDVEARAKATVAEVTRMLRIEELDMNSYEQASLAMYPTGFDALPPHLRMSAFGNE